MSFEGALGVSTAVIVRLPAVNALGPPSHLLIPPPLQDPLLQLLDSTWNLDPFLKQRSRPP